MTTLDSNNYNKIREWMYRNARPLDLARWQYYFENSSSDAIVNALSAYQNNDGGFGNAIEADSWNPDSSPYSTYQAILILEETNNCDAKHRMIKNILSYLKNNLDKTTNRWHATVPSNNDHPHAPWWTYFKDNLTSWGYTPTAALAGFIILNEDKQSVLYQTALQIAIEAIEEYINGKLPDGSEYNNTDRELEISCFYYLSQCLDKAMLNDKFNKNAIIETMKKRAHQFMETDASKWNEYCKIPSTYIDSPKCIFYDGHEKTMELELDYILNQRNADGVWDITWTWNAPWDPNWDSEPYKGAFAISENWWKANIVIKNLLLLKEFHRI